MKRIKIMILLVIIFSIGFGIYSERSYFMTSSTPVLKPGDKGVNVEEMQQRLTNWGYYDGRIDGNFGLKTFLAVRSFQKVYKLNVDGIAGQDTLMKMGFGKVAQSGTAYAEGGGANEVQLLARAINGEARGEPYEGQVAVGAVILNRTRDSRFPKTIPGVIYQPGAFTAVSDGQINVSLDANSTVVKAAQDALNGWDPSNGCVYYWNPATATSKWIWSRQVVAKIGKHYFGK